MRTLTLLLAVVPALLAADAPAARPLPRFTEEREAAARHFVGKHLPEVLPLLDDLKKSAADQYQREVRRIFQATELLAELQGDTARYDLELRIWKAEQLAATQVARLATGPAAETPKVQATLKTLARELVELDVALLQLKTDRLERELASTRDALSRGREEMDRDARKRYEELLRLALKGEK